MCSRVLPGGLSQPISKSLFLQMEVTGEMKIHQNPEWERARNRNEVSSLFALECHHTPCLAYRLCRLPIFSFRNDSQMLYYFALHKLLSTNSEKGKKKVFEDI